MTCTTFKELADSVFLKIKDLDLAQLPEDIAYKIVKSYIKPACVAFQSCNNQDLFDRDDELQQFNFHLDDDTYEILTEYMVVKWLDSQILTTTNLRSRLSLAGIDNLFNSTIILWLISLINFNKSYKNSKLFDLVTGRKKIRK